MRQFSALLLMLLVLGTLALKPSIQSVETTGTVGIGHSSTMYSSTSAILQKEYLLSEPPALQWNKTYGGAGDDHATSVIQTIDGGYAVAGYTPSNGTSFEDFLLVKTDASGNMQWNKTYGEVGVRDEAWSVVQTSDEGYALAGGTGTYAYDWNIEFVKIDSAGNALWNKTYAGAGYAHAYSVIQTADGGYALAGYTASYGGIDDSLLVRTDAAGNLLWNRTYGGINQEGSTSVIQTSDGGYALAGYTNSYGAGSVDFWLVKTDSNGIIQWNQTYGGSGPDVAWSIVQTRDGGYAMTGYSCSFGAGGSDFWLVRTDASGNLLWNRTYGGALSDRANSLVQTGDGGFAMAGNAWLAGSCDFWLVKTDSNGDMQWNATYGGTDIDYAWSMVQTSDGGYAMTGDTLSYGAGGYNFWLVKTAPEQLANVTFNEFGLPPGNTWNVTMNGVTPNSTSDTTITFNEPIGNYPFEIKSTVSTGRLLSPIKQDTLGTINVEADITVNITWLERSMPVIIKEVGLPPSIGWSVTYGCITQTSYTNEIEYNFPMSGGAYSFSASSPGYIAEPASFIANVSGITTNVVFIPTGNMAHFAFWNPFTDSYYEVNPSTTWSNGNCYGLTSTALLYFMRYTMCNNDYPYFPSQLPIPSSAAELVLGDNTTLNNVSLAVMFHQVYDPNNHYDENRVGDVASNFERLSSSLEGAPQQNGIPMIINMWASSGKPGNHAVLAWGVGKLPNGSYAIAIYDPNSPQSTQVAIYDPSSSQFSYTPPWSNEGSYDHIYVVPANEIATSWANLTGVPWWENFLGTYWWWHSWLDWSVPNYYVVMADKMVTINSSDLKDYFTSQGDSRTFVCGIPDSSGIEEGNIQVYAIPSSTEFSVADPASNASGIFMSRIDNESGQIVGYAYLLNTSTTEGYLNYTLTPSDSGLSIVAGDTPLNATVTCYSATQQGYSVSDVLTAQIDAGQNVNLTAPCLASFTASKNVVGKGYAIPVNVTITNAGSNPENISLTLYANGTALDSEMVFDLMNGTSVNLTCLGNTSSCTYGNYRLSVYCQPNGINEAANNFTGGWVVVSIKGDLTGGTQNALDFVPDERVNIVDVAVVAKCFGQKVPPAPANCDVSGTTIGVPDDKIDITDVATVAKHFGEHYP